MNHHYLHRASGAIIRAASSVCNQYAVHLSRGECWPPGRACTMIAARRVAGRYRMRAGLAALLGGLLLIAACAEGGVRGGGAAAGAGAAAASSSEPVAPSASSDAAR